MLEEPLSIWANVINRWCTPTVFFVVLNIVIGTIYITSHLANNTKQDPKHQQNYPHGPNHPQQQLASSPTALQRLKSQQLSPQDQSQPTEAEHTQFAAGSPNIVHQRLNQFNYFPAEPVSNSNFTTQTCNLFKPTHEPENHHLDPTLFVEIETTDEEKEENSFEQTQHEEGEAKPEPEPEPEPSLDEIFSQIQNHHFNRTQSDTIPASGEMPVKLPLPRKMKKSASTISPSFSHFKEDDITVENRRQESVREEKVNAAGDSDGVDAKADDFINKFKQQLKLQRLDSITREREVHRHGP